MVKIMRVTIRMELVKGLDADLSNLWPSLPPSLAQPHLANNIMIIFHDNLDLTTKVDLSHQEWMVLSRKSDQHWTIAEENSIAVGGGCTFSLDF